MMVFITFFVWGLVGSFVDVSLLEIVKSFYLAVVVV